MNREVHVRICERLGVKFPGPTRHQEPPRFVTGATGASPETGRGGGSPMIGNLKLASSMTLIRRLGSPTYWRDCATTPRVGSSKCCRGIGKPLAWQSRRDYPPIASPRSACGAPQMHVRVQCTTRLAHGLQLNGRGPSPMCAHRVLSRPTAWGMCWDNSHEFQHVCPRRAVRLRRLSFFWAATTPAWFGLGVAKNAASSLRWMVRRKPMNDTQLMAAIALTAALLIAPAGAAVFDDSKYPDMKGQWDRVGPPNWTPAGKPPFTPEYQAVYEANITESFR